MVGFRPMNVVLNEAENEDAFRFGAIFEQDQSRIERKRTGAGTS
jgi:hypothetical protein